MHFKIKLKKISVTKGQPDQDVNTRIAKNLNSQATRANFYRKTICNYSRSQVQHNLPKYPGGDFGQTDFYTTKCLKWQKKVSLQFTWVSFLQNRKVYFNQESLPITYHNFGSKNPIRPKRKLARILTHKLQGQFFTER